MGIGSSFVCCGDRQGNLRLWRSKSKNELIKIKAHKEEVLAMDVKSSLIATASRDGTVNLYSIGQVKCCFPILSYRLPFYGDLICSRFT